MAHIRFLLTKENPDCELIRGFARPRKTNGEKSKSLLVDEESDRRERTRVQPYIGEGEINNRVPFKNCAHRAPRQSTISIALLQLAAATAARQNRFPSLQASAAHIQRMRMYAGVRARVFSA